MKTNPGDKAYPSPNNEGLTKREYFAAMALQGWLARCANVPHHAKLEPSTMAYIAVEMADALLKELEQSE